MGIYPFQAIENVVLGGFLIGDQLDVDLFIQASSLVAENFGKILCILGGKFKGQR